MLNKYESETINSLFKTDSLAPRIANTPIVFATISKTSI